VKEEVMVKKARQEIENIDEGQVTVALGSRALQSAKRTAMLHDAVHPYTRVALKTGCTLHMRQNRNKLWIYFLYGPGESIRASVQAIANRESLLKVSK
jgi:hypothetical protein